MEFTEISYEKLNNLGQFEHEKLRVSVKLSDGEGIYLQESIKQATAIVARYEHDDEEMD